MDDSKCTKGGHRLCLLIICILVCIIPAHTHGAAAQTTTLSIEAIQELRTTVDELKAFSKAEKKVNDGIHHSLAVNAETVSRLEENVQGLKDRATSSVEGITELRTTVDQLQAFSKAEKEVNKGIHSSVAVNAETISRLEETLQVLKDKVNQLEQKQSAVESRITLKAENAHFVAIFDETQVNQGLVKFKPSYITTFGSKDGEQRELSANCGSSKWTEDASTGRCYYIVSEELSWSNASTRCQMEGGQLLSIGSPEEQNFINGMLKDIKYDHIYWTGGRRIQGQLPSSDATDGWGWSDGSPFKFTNWAPYEPNNMDGHEDCLQIGWGDHWNDLDCIRGWYLTSTTGTLPYPFCEKPGIIFTDGVFTASISGVYELGFTAWTTVNRSIVVIRKNNGIIASALSNSVGMFGTSVIEELEVEDKVAVFLLHGAIDGQPERSATFFGKLVQRS